MGERVYCVASRAPGDVHCECTFEGQIYCDEVAPEKEEEDDDE